MANETLRVLICPNEWRIPQNKYEAGNGKKAKIS
jgi:hypothetical protein